jgi:hypothetical protein
LALVHLDSGFFGQKDKADGVSAANLSISEHQLGLKMMSLLQRAI